MLSNIFTKARSAHLAWKGKIRGFLGGMIEMDETQAVSHHDCVLGKWLDAEGREQYGHLPEMKELDLVHEKMHTTIREIVKLKKSGLADKAEDLFEEIDPLSKRVVALLDNIEVSVSSGGMGSRNQARPSSAPTSVARGRSAGTKQTEDRAAPSADDSEWNEF